ncbi:heterokaryon incompatibility, partial [Microdochium trichocladiopsis]
TERLVRPDNEPPLRYDALSYTWGDRDHAFTFICNGGQELQIHKNLHDALPYLARRRSSLPIWIDALCINQADEAEKAEQIGLMHHVYRQADMVCIWLGPRRLGQVMPELHALRRAGEERDPAEFGLPGGADPAWAALDELANKKWFCRLWVVQE